MLPLFVGGLLAITGYALWRLHAAAVTDGLENSAMHARGFEDFLTQTLHVADLVAANAVPAENLLPDSGRNGQSGMDLPGIERGFIATLRHAPFLRSMSVLDARGRIVASSNRANVGMTVDMHDYLPHGTGLLDISRIGQPWSGRDFADGQPSGSATPLAARVAEFIPVSRTLMVGARSVTLLLALNPDYFINYFSQKLDASEGSVQVFRYDGRLLMDTDPNARKGSLHLLPELRLPEVESGQFEQDDGKPTLSAFRASHLYPIVVVARLDRDVCLQQFQDGEKAILGVVIPAVLLICLLALAVYRRQIQFAAQRIEVERLQGINVKVFASSREAFVITDALANIISVNASFTRMTGYGAQEVLGRNPRLLSSGQQDKAFYAGMWQELAHNGSWQGELTNRRKDGSLYEIQTTITVSRDASGRLQHYIGTSMDITERKLALLATAAAQQRELATGYNIQQSLLMADVPSELDGAWINTYVEPSQGLHGDFVAVSRHSPTRFNLMVGDVMGKGIHAAMIGAGVKNAYYQVLAELLAQASGRCEIPGPAAILNALHQRMTPKLIEMNCFVTLALYEFDAHAGTMTVVNAGHTEGLLVRAGGVNIERVGGANLPIGVLAAEVYVQHVLSVADDDRLVLYSDGISEACSENGEEFGAERIAAWLLQSRDADLPGSAALQLLRQRLAQFRGTGRMMDDQTLMLIRLRPVCKTNAERCQPNYVVLPFQLDALPLLRRHIEQATLHWQREDAEAILLAVYEAATNAILHTPAALPSACLHCFITAVADSLSIEMFYMGPPVAVDAGRMPDFSGESDDGFGLFIMRSLVDNIEYRVPLEGMVSVRLSKRVAVIGDGASLADAESPLQALSTTSIR